MDRPSWNQYFMNMAEEISKRATCPRLMVGAIIVKDNQILATGYNGSVKGARHCDCYLENNRCVRTIHAEQNAIVQAAKKGVSVEGATIYVNHEPCTNCIKFIIQSGIEKVYFKYPYRQDELAKELIEETGIIIELLEEDE